VKLQLHNIKINEKHVEKKIGKLTNPLKSAAFKSWDIKEKKQTKIFKNIG
jgi:hypothetical protein